MEKERNASANTSEMFISEVSENCLLTTGLLVRHDHPDEDVGENTRYATGDERDNECQADPEGTDAKEFGQSAANAREHAVAF